MSIDKCVLTVTHFDSEIREMRGVSFEITEGEPGPEVLTQMGIAILSAGVAANHEAHDVPVKTQIKDIARRLKGTVRTMLDEGSAGPVH